MGSSELVLKSNFALEEKETQEIDLYIDGLIESHRQNSQELSSMALESVSLITSVEARSSGMMKQGFFSRLWNNFTGTNHKLSTSNQHDIAKSQYLSQQMLNKLFDQNLVQFEMMVNLDHKISILSQDIIKTNQNLFQVCNALSGLFKEQQQIKNEMAEFRRNDDLLFWKDTIRHDKVFQDRPYSQLQKEQKIVCIANEFYTISKGKWENRDLLFLKSVMEEVGLEPDEAVMPVDVLKSMLEDNKLLQQFFKKTGYDIAALSPDIACTPFSACLAKLEKLEGEENYLIETICKFTSEVPLAELRLQMAMEYVRALTSRDLKNEISCFDMVMDLISDLFMNNLEVQRDLLVSCNEPVEVEVEVQLEPNNTDETLESWQFCYVQAGNFVMGEDNKEEICSVLDYPFWMGRYPVTNEQYDEFIQDGGYQEKKYWDEAVREGVWEDGEIDSRDRPDGNKKSFKFPFYPVFGVSWYEAIAFTRWLTETWHKKKVLPKNWCVTLPSEAQWEKAARGGFEIPEQELICPVSIMNSMMDKNVRQKKNRSPGRCYCWGDDSDAAPELANCEESAIGTTSAVGSFSRGKSPYGCEDMNGNVWEWTRSIYEDYPYDPEDGRENLNRIKKSTNIIMRGGCFLSDEEKLRCGFRSRRSPHYLSNNLGFRFVAAPSSDL
ncbi:formylglycine-generating enzyme family protein [Desulfobacterales bacterium HSG16]|nr:formylglycine-generating enzyme family protein [Desulfobacterales bacterium HSG16]